MDLKATEIDRMAAAMWAVYQKNLISHPPDEDEAAPLVAWKDAETSDRLVWKAMALRAYIELRDMGMIAI